MKKSNGELQARSPFAWIGLELESKSLFPQTLINLVDSQKKVWNKLHTDQPRACSRALGLDQDGKKMMMLLIGGILLLRKQSQRSGVETRRVTGWEQGRQPSCSLLSHDVPQLAFSTASQLTLISLWLIIYQDHLTLSNVRTFSSVR